VTVGQIAPDFTVQTLDGKTIQLSKSHGKVIRIQFFATWCGPCNEEVATVEKKLWPKYW
jgi:peroxiredoxin